jgi:hypothetical protein
MREKIPQQLNLLIDEQLGITNHFDKQEMRDLEWEISVRL